MSVSAPELSLVVYPRGKPLKGLPTEVKLPRSSKGSELYGKIAKSTNASVHRIRITKGSDGNLIPNTGDVSLNEAGLMGGSKIMIKDLGPQIAWRTVFLIEYLGPLLIHPLFYYLRPYIYTPPPFNMPFPAASTLQRTTCVLITLHFLKRELETLFIHRFSAATMPARNILKNSAHYWLLAGLNIAYWVYSPVAPARQPASPFILYLGVALFVVGEVGNANSHLVLMNLRAPGTKERGIPKGMGFGLVTCPNYMWETVAWVGIALVSWSWATVVFAGVAVGQMAVWARKKERAYRREFGGGYRAKRFAMLPGVI
ncbi:3-oxo-5a-steroid 4- dehydrogenase [Agyrium rufum]|nr:3-oxo-5a-steroid 4- dehydrogenase [Agyrium rufum]